jgi:GSH-dependent disulfide-bond oxidoreductase
MITVYGAGTTNTRKVTIALEELGLPYTPHGVALDRAEQKQDWFLQRAPNNKVPFIEDDATGLDVWETGAILIYLADHYDPEGLILPKTGKARYAAIQSALFQAAHIGPNLGRLNDQLTAPDDKKNPGMIALFMAEAVRLTEVLDRMLGDGRPYIAGEYSIADIMHYPWLKAALDMRFPAMMEKQRITEWLHRLAERPAVRRGMAAFE